MKHSELPKWLRKTLPKNHLGYRVTYPDVDRLLSEARTLEDLNGAEIKVRAQIPGRCWHCGRRYQEGTLLGWYGDLQPTLRHTRRRDCSYTLGSNPAVQEFCVISIRLKLSAK